MYSITILNMIKTSNTCKLEQLPQFYDLSITKKRSIGIKLLAHMHICPLHKILLYVL